MLKDYRDGRETTWDLAEEIADCEIVLKKFDHLYRPIGGGEGHSEEPGEGAEGEEEEEEVGVDEGDEGEGDEGADDGEDDDGDEGNAGGYRSDERVGGQGKSGTGDRDDPK
ncbi:prothymosin alpha-like [Tripterygium wilfordii]|uniref:prothymosin alpha-like n=1 Tax=Tripterygium wilfordii TaxID=458696 RepID=UPI0018F8617A|nr:prothymosin alpha-like [Tripterygium wilfordii]